jgi:hypothetical protein
MKRASCDGFNGRCIDSFLLLLPVLFAFLVDLAPWRFKSQPVVWGRLISARCRSLPGNR